MLLREVLPVTVLLPCFKSFHSSKPTVTLNHVHVSHSNALVCCNGISLDIKHEIDILAANDTDYELEAMLMSRTEWNAWSDPIFVDVRCRFFVAVKWFIVN